MDNKLTDQVCCHPGSGNDEVSSSQNSTAKDNVFQHDPLNYEAPDIRVIQVLPEFSSGNLIQCTIRHTDTSDTYICLSYVWGEPSSEKYRILINERHYWVHQNLWEFLSVARIRYHSTSLWIDAICIDQNAVLERNHQVQHMGDIFSGASRVIAWLGNGEETISFMALLREHQMLATIHAPRTSTKRLHDVVTGIQHFSMLNYWQRAWITQEIALARSTTFVSGYEELDQDQLPFNEDEWTESPAGQLACRKPYPKAERSIHQMLSQFVLGSKRYSLVYLLDLFAYKHCHIDRDRIYSLLSLCAEGSDLVPDYRISDESVLLRTLNCCSRSLCLCTLGSVASVLKIDPFSCSNHYVEFEAVKSQVQDWSSLITDTHESMSMVQSRCELCRVPRHFNPRIAGKTYYTFCLSAICEEFRGHLFFDITDPHEIVTVQAHVSIPLQEEHLQLSNFFQIDADVHVLSEGDDSDALFRIRFSLQDALRMVMGRGRWWRRRHIYEQQYHGPLTLVYIQGQSFQVPLSLQTIVDLFGSRMRPRYSDFEIKRRQIQGERSEFWDDIAPDFAFLQEGTLSTEDYIAWKLPGEEEEEDYP